ncbi:MAG: hypothetical protein M1817_002349 [Caeruleum heppii]|nr:MAG: hypothetical protein M1817_003466 [Caeruleum heppii]KAI9673711.1 MAG: hypothetical protein M1817_002349 [Caeruleum heppii]
MPGIVPMKLITLPTQAQTRIAQACDRCRSKKIRCDGVRPCCSQCATVGFECKTSDKLSRRAFPRGYTESLEERVRALEAEVRELKEALDAKDEIIEIMSKIQNGGPSGNSSRRESEELSPGVAPAPSSTTSKPQLQPRPTSTSASHEHRPLPLQTRPSMSSSNSSMPAPTPPSSNPTPVISRQASTPSSLSQKPPKQARKRFHSPPSRSQTSSAAISLAHQEKIRRSTAPAPSSNHHRPSVSHAVSEPMLAPLLSPTSHHFPASTLNVPSHHHLLPYHDPNDLHNPTSSSASSFAMNLDYFPFSTLTSNPDGSVSRITTPGAQNMDDWERLLLLSQNNSPGVGTDRQGNLYDSFLGPGGSGE